MLASGPSLWDPGDAHGVEPDSDLRPVQHHQEPPLRRRRSLPRQSLGAKTVADVAVAVAAVS